MKNHPQQQQVKNFFDNIASGYQQKFHPQHSFLHYFFHQRLFEATASFNFEKKTVLDIGAGTGALYSFLQTTTTQFEYFAIDIASQMLENSKIPKAQYFIGDISNFPFPKKKYDYIFLLGVTTYFPPKVFHDHLNFIKSHLNANGIVIISFTNRDSFDFKIRQVARFFTRKMKWKKHVMGQAFEITAYSPQEIKNIVKKDFSIQSLNFLNQTLPPFNRIFPKRSIQLAKFLKQKSSPRILSSLSSDFLIFLKKNENTF